MFTWQTKSTNKEGCDQPSAVCKEIENLCHICIEVLGSLICSLDEGKGQQTIIFQSLCSKSFEAILTGKLFVHFWPWKRGEGGGGGKGYSQKNSVEVCSTHLKTLTPHVFMIKMAKLIPYLWPKRLKTIPFGAAHTYIAHNGSTSLGLLIRKCLIQWFLEAHSATFHTNSNN